jgi:hypothetical protein
VIAALAVCVVAATVVAATASVYDNRAFPNEARYRRDAESVFRLLAPRVDSYRGHTVVIGGDPALVPAIAGVALKLEDAGVGIRVTDALVPTFGPERRAPANRDADIVVSTDTPRGYERLGTTTAVMLRSRVVVSVPAP